jgi:hypothetical protein
MVRFKDPWPGCPFNYTVDDLRKLGPSQCGVCDHRWSCPIVEAVIYNRRL